MKHDDDDKMQCLNPACFFFWYAIVCLRLLRSVTNPAHRPHAGCGINLTAPNMHPCFRVWADWPVGSGFSFSTNVPVINNYPKPAFCCGDLNSGSGFNPAMISMVSFHATKAAP